MANGNGNGNGANPISAYGAILEAGRRWGVFAVLTVGGFCGGGWFLWKQTEFIQSRLVNALEESSVSRSSLAKELQEFATSRIITVKAMQEVAEKLSDRDNGLEAILTAVLQNQKAMIQTQEVLSQNQKLLANLTESIERKAN